MRSRSLFKGIHPTSRGANEAFLGNCTCSSVLSNQQTPVLTWNLRFWACVTCTADDFHKMLIFHKTCRNLVSIEPLTSATFGWNCPLSSTGSVEWSWEADEQRQGHSHRILFLKGISHKYVPSFALEVADFFFSFHVRCCLIPKLVLSRPSAHDVTP